jgi:hypothetical protein
MKAGVNSIKRSPHGFIALLKINFSNLSITPRRLIHQDPRNDDTRVSLCRMWVGMANLRDGRRHVVDHNDLAETHEEQAREARIDFEGHVTYGDWREVREWTELRSTSVIPAALIGALVGEALWRSALMSAAPDKKLGCSGRR